MRHLATLCLLVLAGTLIEGRPSKLMPYPHWRCINTLAGNEMMVCKVVQQINMTTPTDRTNFRSCEEQWIRPPELVILCVGVKTMSQELVCYSPTDTVSPLAPIPCMFLPRIRPAPTAVPVVDKYTTPANFETSPFVTEAFGPYCEVILVSAAVWKAGDPFRMTILLGTTTTESASVTITPPSGAVLSFAIERWENLTWIVKEEDLAKHGPPDWILVQQTPECQTKPLVEKFHRLGLLFVNLTHEPGNYSLLIRTQETHTIQIDPLIVSNKQLSQGGTHIVGSHVLKTDIRERVLVRPQMSLKEIRIDLAELNVTQRLPQCAPYLEAGSKGWNAWLQLWIDPSPSLSRARRSIADWTAPAAGGLAIMDSVNIETLANKFAHVTTSISDLGKPVVQSLNSISNGQHEISSILVNWESQIERDFSLLLKGTQSLERNMSIAMACMQAQQLNQAVAMGLIRQATDGHLPLEIKRLIMPKWSPIELELESWWSLVNSSFSPTTQELKLFLLTASAHESFHVYPVVPLGLQVSDTEVLYARHPDHWARFTPTGWQLVSLQGCQHRDQTGFICQDQAFAPHHPCVAPQVDALNECSFEVVRENSSAVVYLGKGCACVRTACDFVILNSFQLKPVIPGVNRCFCNLSSVAACDFTYTVPVWTQEEILVAPSIYRYVKPVSLGIGLELIHELLAHPQLHRTLQSIQRDGDTTALVVSHNGKEILDLVQRIKTTGEHSWWETLFGWSPTATGIYNLALHPIIVILAFQVLLCASLLYLGCWSRRQLQQLQLSYRLDHYNPDLLLP